MNGWNTRRPTKQGTNYGGTWKRVRLAVLDRDGWTCTIRLPGCTPDLRVKGNATVDHILPVVLGGSSEPSNLRAACRSCNLKLGAKLGRRRQGTPTTPRKLNTSRRWL